jgi:transposase
MIGKKTRQPELFIPGDIGDFVPDDHILKRVDSILDLAWLEHEVAHLYCADNGRASVPPEAAVRLMLAGFFAGITQDRKLLREAQVNLAMRWFAGYNLTDALPHHSSLTRIRQRWGQDIFRRIFTRTVAQCLDAGLVNGDTVHIDATLIRADVSWESLTDQWVDATLADNAPEPEPPAPGSDPGSKKKRKPNKTHGHPRARQRRPKKRSLTDPDATLTTNKKSFVMEPSFKQHTAVDDAAGVIVDVEITTGEDSEGARLMHTIERVEATLGEPISRITADAAYAHSANYAALEERAIDAVIPPQKPNNCHTPMPACRFKYDARHQHVRCPRGRRLTRRSRVKNGWVYRGSAATCGRCPLRASCCPATAKVRAIFIADGHEALLRARRRRTRWDADTINWYKRHRWRVEGIHGEAKQQHGLRRAARRGMSNVAIQAYLTAAAINLKRLAPSLLHAFWASQAYSDGSIASPRNFRPCAELFHFSDDVFGQDHDAFKSAA